MSDYSSIGAINWSSLKYLSVSPKMYQWRRKHPEPSKEGYVIGAAAHTLILEPKEFPKRYGVWDRQTKAGKTAPRNGQFWDAWQAENPGKQSLTPAEMELVERIAGAVADHPKAHELFSGGRREESLIWTNKATGMLCKGRLDYITPVSVRDLKTTGDVSERGTTNTMARFLYHGQLAFYHDGAIAAGKIPGDSEPPWCVWVQKVGPFDVAVEQLSPRDLRAGRLVYEQFLYQLKDCMDVNYWPGVCPDYRETDLPSWAPGKMDADSGFSAIENFGG